MIFFVRNALVLQIFLLALAYSWIHGGTRPELLLPVIPWCVAFLFEMVLVFPQSKSTETLNEARRRVWGGISRDPLFYLSIIVTVLLVIPLFNVAGAPFLNQAGTWINPEPPLAGLPFCCYPDEHASLLLWFPPVLFGSLAVRYGLLKRGKRILLEMLCWNGFALALFGFLQLATDATSVFWGEEKFSTFFSTFGYPNIAGAFFTLLFALSFGIWFFHVSKRDLGPTAVADTTAPLEPESPFVVHRMLLPTVANFLAAIATLSRAAILLSLTLLGFFVLYAVVGLWQKAVAGTRYRIVAAAAVVVISATLFFTLFAGDALKKELKTINSDAISERLSGRGQYHARVAGEIFRLCPVYGVGGWGYAHYQMQFLTPEEQKRMQIYGGINVHNDSLQFLAEQGLVGFGALLICVAFVQIPLWKSLFKQMASGAEKRSYLPKPAFLYAVSPVTVATFAGTTATVIHSFGDLPFRDPAVLLVWFFAFVCAPGFSPARRG